jgi:hypothetical protein
MDDLKQGAEFNVQGSVLRRGKIERAVTLVML